MTQGVEFIELMTERLRLASREFQELRAQRGLVREDLGRAETRLRLLAELIRFDGGVVELPWESETVSK